MDKRQVCKVTPETLPSVDRLSDFRRNAKMKTPCVALCGKETESEDPMGV